VTPVTAVGRVTNIIWMHRDVTEVQEQQRMLQLRSRVLNFMSDGIFIADCDGSVLYTNQGFVKLTGYDQREAVGRPWTFLLVRALVEGGASHHFLREMAAGVVLPGLCSLRTWRKSSQEGVVCLFLRSLLALGNCAPEIFLLFEHSFLHALRHVYVGTDTHSDLFCLCRTMG